MPGLNKHLFVLQHETCDTVQFMLPESSSSISAKAVAVDKKEVAKCADSPIF